MANNKPNKQNGSEVIGSSDSTAKNSEFFEAQKKRVRNVLDKTENGKTEEMTEKEKFLFGKLDKTQQIPEKEREKFKELYFSLPKKIRKRYLGPLKYSLSDKNPVHILTKFRAYLFELTRRELILIQGLEKIEEYEYQPILVEYLGYENNQKDFENPPGKPLGGNNFGDIENDVDGLTRGNKMYLYETKLMAIKIYGKEYGRHEAAKSRNQLLKYQTAITQGKIAGATIEIRGVIDTEFFDWMQRPDTIPDLEILYSLELPSGSEYRFIIKKGEGEGLRFQNDNKAFNDDDLEIVNSIEAVIKGNIELLKKCVAEIDLSESIQGTELTDREIEKPYEINSLAKYHTYQSIKLKGIWERFKLTLE